MPKTYAWGSDGKQDLSKLEFLPLNSGSAIF